MAKPDGVVLTLFCCCMCTLMLSIMHPPVMNTYRLDFGTAKEGQNWVVVNDQVMGGRSIGTVRLEGNSLLFTGTVSLDNNGGFSALRGPYGRFDLSEFHRVVIRYRSRRMDMAMSLQTSRMWFQPNFKVSIPNSEWEWTVLDIPLNTFAKYRLGNPMGTFITRNNLEEVIRIGFITDEKRAGAFELEIDYLEFQ